LNAWEKENLQKCFERFPSLRELWTECEDEPEANKHSNSYGVRPQNSYCRQALWRYVAKRLEEILPREGHTDCLPPGVRAWVARLFHDFALPPSRYCACDSCTPAGFQLLAKQNTYYRPY
jgi:hypothetical protein